MKYKIYNGIEIDIDAEDLPLITKSLKPNCSWYCSRKNKQIKGWVIMGGKCKKIILSRLIMNVLDSPLDVDHINGNRLDNRKQNLRLCSHQENCFNTFSWVIDKGIRFRPSRKKWQARIRTKIGRITLGSFSSKEEAQKAYNEAVVKYHGEFAPRI